MSAAKTLREANIARAKEWHGADPMARVDLSFRGNELAGEVGEACNIIKKLERERLGFRGSRATVAQLAEELGDVVICADLIAMQLGLDLDAAVEAKFNATSEKLGLLTRFRRA
jgi:NTP pyrophosphatase (non-canonical NTP hydrolase)